MRREGFGEWRRWQRKWNQQKKSGFSLSSAVRWCMEALLSSSRRDSESQFYQREAQKLGGGRAALALSSLSRKWYFSDLVCACLCVVPFPESFPSKGLHMPERVSSLLDRVGFSSAAGSSQTEEERDLQFPMSSSRPISYLLFPANFKKSIINNELSRPAFHAQVFCGCCECMDKTLFPWWDQTRFPRATCFLRVLKYWMAEIEIKAETTKKHLH